MIPTTYYMERTAAMPTAAPMGVVGFVLGASMCTLPSAKHRAAFGPVFGITAAVNSAKPWAFWMGRQLGLTTDRSARHLGRSST
jgi:predicted alpha/beta hydrolase